MAVQEAQSAFDIASLPVYVRTETLTSFSSTEIPAGTEAVEILPAANQTELTAAVYSAPTVTELVPTAVEEVPEEPLAILSSSNTRVKIAIGMGFLATMACAAENITFGSVIGGTYIGAMIGYAFGSAVAKEGDKQRAQIGGLFGGLAGAVSLPFLIPTEFITGFGWVFVAGTAAYYITNGIRNTVSKIGGWFHRE